MKRLSYALLVISLVALGYTIVWASTRPVEVPEVQAAAKEELPLTRDNLLKLVNEERAKVGVAPLVMDGMLNESAQWKADDMKAYNYFGHSRIGETNSNGVDYLGQLNQQYPICTAGSENIVFAQTLEIAMDWWKNSPSHYGAMVDKDYTLTGFGIVYIENMPKENITSSTPVDFDMIDSYMIVEHFCVP